jgi:hypothetical protein
MTTLPPRREKKESEAFAEAYLQVTRPQKMLL